MILREQPQNPPGFYWYEINVLSRGDEGDIVEWEEIPIQFFDGTTVYSTNHSTGVYDPDLVYSKFQELKNRDSLYNSAGMLVQSIIGDTPIYRYDHPPKVVLGIDGDYAEEYGAQVADALMQNFGDKISNGLLAVVWGDYSWGST